MPGLTIGDTVPNLELDSTHGRIRIHDFIGDGYVIIFSHPGMLSSCLHRGLILRSVLLLAMLLESAHSFLLRVPTICS